MSNHNILIWTNSYQMLPKSVVSGVISRGFNTTALVHLGLSVDM